jgi:endo-1,3(4)-beta-glucanase
MDTEKLNRLFIREDEEKQDHEAIPSCCWSREYWTPRPLIFALCFVIPAIIIIIIAFVVPLHSTKYFPKDCAIPNLENSTIITMASKIPPPINLATKPRLVKKAATTTAAYGFGQPREFYGFGQAVDRTATSTSATSATAGISSADVSDITVPIATSAPPPQFTWRQHPVQPEGFPQSDLQKPIETNKWWGNIPIPGAETGNLFAFPYTVWYSNTTLYGMNIMHTDASQRVYDTAHSPPQFYYSPVGIVSWNMGATEFSTDIKMSLDTPTQFSINVNLVPGSGSGTLQLPLVNGMAYVTGIYSDLTPYLTTSGKAILSYQNYIAPSSTKYKVGFNDGTTWLIYAFPSTGNTFSLSQNGNSLVGNGKFSGYIQIAKIPTGNTAAEALYDAYSGTYVTGMALFGSTSSWTGTYGFKFTTAGKTSSSLLHFALPHHMASFDSTTQNTATAIYLQSTTMGLMQAYTATTWTMTETLPLDITFLPGGAEVSSFSAKALSAIASAVEADVQQDISSLSNLDSQYFAGKALAMYAEICLVANDILKNSSLAATCLSKLKTAFARFSSNQQQAPLCYDYSWKGLVSTAGFNDSGADFGNTYYNDHHYHYGYFVHTAAIIGRLDSTWLTQSNIDYVESLIRDVANPSSSDPYYPVFRSFDWFVGHSWSKGLFFSADGKDEESGSEDYNFAYGMKLWGIVTQNSAMHARANLMLAVMKRYLLAPLSASFKDLSDIVF